MLEVCSGVTNRREKMEGARGSDGLWSEGPRVTGASLCAKCSNICYSLGSLVVRIMCVVRVVVDRWIYLLGESASPFIDKGDILTSERERLRMLLSLVAHVDGYKMMVDAHNTV